MMASAVLLERHPLERTVRDGRSPPLRALCTTLLARLLSQTLIELCWPSSTSLSPRVPARSKWPACSSSYGQQAHPLPAFMISYEFVNCALVLLLA
jgi:hypothetical protein